MGINTNVCEIFGANVFNEEVMKARLPQNTYIALKNTIDLGVELKLEVANVVANVMKDWAIEKGATHFTHWFQPLTGRTAEKHDSFISPTGTGKALMVFSGKELTMGEPDASSFPNGGLRATFEGRGYTVWDCTSPAFIKDNTLCIPTAFCSYTGEALDKKTPLLRSMEAVSAQVLRILRLFGNTTTTKVLTTVGPEQEYFIIDKRLYQKRKDIILTGRTLFGAKPSKGQELDDHYFGSIKESISLYMRELDKELWRLGVAARTKHNEVAPAQHELAPIYSTTNIATDHNHLVMDTMVKVATHHDLVCLLHEKPFEGFNGSGKHNNWSICTNDGNNLLEPGKTPHENMQFLVFLLAIIAAVDEYAPLLRMSASTAANDHRLGANEAPPAIISVFLGEQLNDIVEQIIAGKLDDSKDSEILNIGVSTLPKFRKDATDRNRTSPFAFTGNKFEFRMVGSSQSISDCNTVINTMVAEHLKRIADELEEADDFNKKVFKIITRLAKKHSRVIFNGDGYSEEWVKEAERRGLPNIKTTVEAISNFNNEENVKLLTAHKIFTKEEILARQEIMFEEYSKIINIEARTMCEIARKEILPACINYATSLANSISSIRDAVKMADTSTQEELLISISSLISEAQAMVNTLEKELEKAVNIKCFKAQAYAYSETVFPAMKELRKPCDMLETLVSHEYWPYPTYTDLLFRV